jgi:hypothetical protein
LANQVYRHAEAGRLLIDQGYGHEANVFARTALEHTIVLHWIVVKGSDGLEEFFARKAKINQQWMKSAKAFWKFKPDVIDRFAEEADLADDAKLLNTIKGICLALKVPEVYDMYGFSSNYVHPSLMAISSFIASDDNTGQPVGVTTPIRDSGDMALALLTASVLWTEAAVDRMRTTGKRFDRDLVPLGQELGFNASLPFPEQVPPETN